MIPERQETNEVSPMTAPALPAWFPDWGGGGGGEAPRWSSGVSLSWGEELGAQKCQSGYCS